MVGHCAVIIIFLLVHIYPSATNYGLFSGQRAMMVGGPCPMHEHFHTIMGLQARTLSHCFGEVGRRMDALRYTFITIWVFGSTTLFRAFSSLLPDNPATLQFSSPGLPNSSRLWCNRQIPLYATPAYNRLVNRTLDNR